ncbi:MAG: phage terminase large subunit [Phascolarctobacterium sp.]|uniref:phage terminase large subunit n=1 Tax=Phascolarctobacterium sp. TaxID=2049039 RepID=UPI0026DC0AC6|nr:phage terminase large subunit [Phascolarctobacterium sp.]MDO4921405.1 phage terminase large subunit [Phascolarctobacterium sp.]
MIYWDDEQVKRAKGDFRVFLFIVWKEIGLPNPTPIQIDMAHTLQYPPNDRFILEGFRGVAKSFITCAFAVWTLWNDPQKKVLIVSASKDRADANAIFIKRIIFALEFLTFLRPRKDQRDTQNIFDVAPAVPDISPSVKSVGITGQITGSRADVLIADDVEIPNNSGTQVQRDKLSEAVKEFDSIIKPKGRIIYLGTPQNEMSLYNELQNRGYDCIIYPVVYPEDNTIREFYGERLAKIIADKYDSNPMAYAGYPTDPQRFNEEEIDARRLSYGKAGFALQFLLNTNLSDAEKYPLKVADLIVTALDMRESSLIWAWASGNQQRHTDLPCVALKGDYFYAPLSRSNETAKYQTVIMFVDPSGRGRDETAYAIVAFLNGYLFLLDVDGFQDGYSDDVLRNIATRAKAFNVNTILVEPNFGNGMFAKLLIPFVNKIYPGCAVEDSKTASVQKEARIIDTLEPVMMRHKLIVNQQVIENDYKVYERDPQYSLIYQMTRLSRDRGALAHDDRLDAVEGAVAYFLEMVSMSEQQGLDELNEEQLEKWLDPDYGIFYKDENSIQDNKLLQKKKQNDFSKYNVLGKYYAVRHG